MNNSFLQCISDICGTELSSVVSGGKYSVYGNTVAVVEGHKGIAFYSREKVCFSCVRECWKFAGTIWKYVVWKKIAG